MRNCSLLALCLAMLTPTMLFADDNGGGIRVQTIKVSSVSPFLTLKFWDYEAEDGDWVRIVVDGETYREFELKNAPKTVSIPILFSDKDEVLVNVIGTKSGNGPVTYAVQATGLGSSVEVYKNYADVGSGNSYRIVKTKDDIFSVGVGYVAGLLGMGEEGDEAGECAKWHSEKEQNVAIMESAYETALVAIGEMRFWGGMALLFRHGSIGLAQIAGYVRPEISAGVSATWTVRDVVVGEYDATGLAKDARKELGNKDLEDVLKKQANGRPIKETIERYEKAARTKNAGVINKLEALKNAAKGGTAIGLGDTFVQYGKDQSLVDGKCKSSLRRLEDAGRKIELYKSRKCPICGKR